MKVLRALAILIVGILFMFSGVVKAIDPLGSAYKFHDYFIAFGTGYLQFLAVPLSLLQSLVEFLAGFAVITGIRRREGIWATMILMAFFTPLTLILALTNPVSDCGCFGDAIHLTNWQTFGKNVVLVFFAIILFAERKKDPLQAGPSAQWLVTGCAAVVFVAFEFYNLTFLPVIDFLPYSVGTHIPDKMRIPEGAPVTRYETTFIYEKGGLKKEFTLKDYPANDSTWKFIRQNSKIISKGYIPPVHDFAITMDGNRDITDSVLNSLQPVVLMICKKLEDAGMKRIEKGTVICKTLSERGIHSLLLSSSGSDEILRFRNMADICTADETTLKTMIRSNPGYMLLFRGTVLGKWSWADFSADKVIKLTGNLKLTNN
ncbi:MAG TPA: BT_3928 family protein [Bacteroidales bacterium]|nr:BT_3928 family protein [Bacteroidales bacterium]